MVFSAFAVAAEGGTSASSVLPAETASPAMGQAPATLSPTSGVDVETSAAGAPSPVPAALPPIFPLLPAFRWRLEDGTPLRVEVCVVIVDRAVRVIARDALAAAGLPLSDYEQDPGCDSDPYREHAAARAFTLDTLFGILHPLADRPRVNAFLTWVGDHVSALVAQGIHRTGGEPDILTIRDAAAVLDAEPGIQMGQTRLFEYLATIGWIVRDGDTWRPTSAVHDAGLLVVQHVTIPSHVRDDAYPQIHITRPGLTELTRRLGGSTTLTD